MSDPRFDALVAESERTGFLPFDGLRLLVGVLADRIEDVGQGDG